MKNSSWYVVVGLAAVAACLAGCDGGGRDGSIGTSAASAAPSGSSSPVVVTWQPPDKPAEFLSAWRRPKD
ncbi:hypothetical protein QTH90_23100 [Variovorax sp. J2P1-59]|uniref:hypothetical protein n=1 Tax=Variovorax flavidus TaxID=3053501 RepID=UPI00257628E0|nr:hypothetical protein [Variovorax sp. J2P1-59]MDM0077312.1 hypothetical protein [Variovorax sp. J2P1-59]